MQMRSGLLGAVVLVSTCLSWGCSTRDGAFRTNVVFIMVDQLRKDSADLWAVRLTQLASRGIVLDRMRSVAPWTYPSVISLMSGLYPQQHGADGKNNKVLTTFDSQVPLLPRILRAHGFQTAAFVANPFLDKWNPFHEGFDTYDTHFINSQGNRWGFGGYVWTEQMFADTVNRAIVSHFDAHPYSGPEFTYVHYIDVHGPWKGAPFPPNYKDSVRYIDERLVEIYDYFNKRYDGDMLFFVSSDHGRALEDDEALGYGSRWRKSKRSIHDFNLLIPFMILPSKVVTHARVVSTPGTAVDFVPTLLEWLDIPLTYPSPGISLLPAIRGEKMPAGDRALYARHSGFKAHSDCIVYQDKKYARFFNPRSGEVIATRIFDLRRDPRETTSLGTDFGEVLPLFHEAAGEHGMSFPARVDPLDAEVESKLRALGYLK